MSSAIRRAWLRIVNCCDSDRQEDQPSIQISEPFDFRKHDEPMALLEHGKQHDIARSAFSSKSNLLGDIQPSSARTALQQEDFLPGPYTRASSLHTDSVVSLSSRHNPRPVPIYAHTTPWASASTPNLIVTSPSYTMLKLPARTQSRLEMRWGQDGKAAGDAEAKERGATTGLLASAQDEEGKLSLDFM